MPAFRGCRARAKPDYETKDYSLQPFDAGELFPRPDQCITSEALDSNRTSQRGHFSADRQNMPGTMTNGIARINAKISVPSTVTAVEDLSRKGIATRLHDSTYC